MPVAIRRLGVADLFAYKAMRDEMLEAHPEAFTSDAATDRPKDAVVYLHRLGLDRRDGGQFVLAAWSGDELVGALGCERDERVKVRHIGHVAGMMVRPHARRQGVGSHLLDACIESARRVANLERLTLTVTADNQSAIRLYERAGFTQYGTLQRALKIGSSYHDKLHMALSL